MRTSLCVLAFAFVSLSASATAGARLTLNGQQIEIEDPVSWGDWNGPAERKAGEKQQDWISATSGQPVKRDPASGLPTGQRMHKPMVMRREQGSITVTVPAGTCTAGGHYPTATLASDEQVYELHDATVAGCAASPKKTKGSGRPTESLTLNYTSVTFSNGETGN